MVHLSHSNRRTVQSQWIERGSGPVRQLYVPTMSEVQAPTCRMQRGRLFSKSAALSVDRAAGEAYGTDEVKGIHA